MKKKFKNYRIIEEFASSVWTMVYKAVQEPLDRIVSLKVLNTKMMGGEELRRRFEREAKICANLVHPNIVRLFDYGQWRGEYFIVQEWIDGVSLKAFIKQNVIKPEVALFIMKEVASGLAYAHEKGVVHRDIKPGNVLIGRDGSVKITDFGLACSLYMPEITLDGTLLGTPAYSAPEQLMGAKVDERADIFSLGVVSYEMMAGVNPFEAESYSVVLERIRRAQPKALHRVNPSVPYDLARVIQRMISKRPVNRYQNLPAFAKDLSSISIKIPSSSSKNLVSYFTPPPVASGKPVSAKPSYLLWLLPLLGGLLSVAILSILFSRPLLDFLDGKEKANSQASTSQVVESLSAGTEIAAPVLRKEIPSSSLGLKDAKPAPISSTVVKNEGKAQMSSSQSSLDTKSYLRFGVKPWARIYVDGQYLETTPSDRLLVVSPGSHKLTLINDYFPPREEFITINPGQTLSLQIDLIESSSWLNLVVKPWGEVYIDGTHISTTPLTAPIILKPGKHRLVITHPTLPSYEATIELSSGDTLYRTVVLNDN